MNAVRPATNSSDYFKHQLQGSVDGGMRNTSPLKPSQIQPENEEADLPATQTAGEFVTGDIGVSVSPDIVEYQVHHNIAAFASAASVYLVPY